jgi:hypothetical protein
MGSWVSDIRAGVVRVSIGVWELIITFDVMLTGLLLFRPPFTAKSQPSLAAKISEGQLKPLPPQYSQELNRLVRAMMHIDVG